MSWQYWASQRVCFVWKLTHDGPSFWRFSLLQTLMRNRYIHWIVCLLTNLSYFCSFYFYFWNSTLPHNRDVKRCCFCVALFTFVCLVVSQKVWVFLYLQSCCRTQQSGNLHKLRSGERLTTSKHCWGANYAQTLGIFQLRLNF